MSITHRYVSTQPNGGNPALVQASNWNDTHFIASGTITNPQMAPGAQFVIVSSSGPNDGGDFGPNTPGTSTQGFQEAYASFGGSNGRMIIKAGRYLLTNTFTISGSSVELDGEGDATQIGIASGIVGIQVLGPAPYGVSGPNQVTIKNLTITYASGQASQGLTGLLIKNAFGTMIDKVRIFAGIPSGEALRIETAAGNFMSNIYVEGSYGAGFHFKGARDVNAVNLFADTCSGNGFMFETDASANNNFKSQFTNCRATINGKGYSIFDTADTTFNYCLADNNIAFGFQIGDSKLIDLNSCRALGNSGGNLQIASNSETMANCNIRVIGGSYEGAPNNNIVVLAQNGYPVSNVSFKGVTSVDAGLSGTGVYDGFRILTDTTSGSQLNKILIDGCFSYNSIQGNTSQQWGVNIISGINTTSGTGTSGTYIVNSFLGPNTRGAVGNPQWAWTFGTSGWVS